MNSVELGVVGLLLLMVLPPLAAAVCAAVGIIRWVRTRRRPSVAALILLGLGLLLSALYAVLSLMASRGGLHLYVLGKGWSHWQGPFSLVAVAPLLVGGLLLGVRRILSLQAAGGLTVLLLWLLLMGGLTAFGSWDCRYTEVTSPAVAGEVHELVFEEKSWLFAGEGAVYERVSPLFMRMLDNYPLHDCSFPAASAEATFDWREDGFTVRYHGQEKEIRYAE